jgi:hypothetical protein
MIKTIRKPDSKLKKINIRGFRYTILKTSFLTEFYKIFIRAVIGLLGIIGKETGRKLTHGTMI